MSGKKNHTETAWSSEVEVHNLNYHLLVHISAWEKCQSIFSFCSVTFLFHSALEKPAWFVPERKLVSKLISHREKWVCTLSPKQTFWLPLPYSWPLSAQTAEVSSVIREQFWHDSSSLCVLQRVRPDAEGGPTWGLGWVLSWALSLA